MRGVKSTYLILFLASVLFISSCGIQEEDSPVQSAPPSDPMLYLVAGDGTMWQPESRPSEGEPMDGPVVPYFLVTGTYLTEPDFYTCDNSQVRYIPRFSGTHYGRSMQADRVYTIGDNETVAHFPGHEGGIPFYEYVSGGGSGEFGSVGNAGPKVLNARQEGVYVYATGTIWFIARTGGYIHGRSVQAGHAYAIFGDFTERGFAGDGGPSQNAKFNLVHNIERDSDDNFYILDRWNQRVRFVPSSSGSYFGQTMQGDYVYTIVGGGQTQSDNETPLLDLEFVDPWALALDSEGNLFVVDAGMERVKFVPRTDGNYYSQDMMANKIYTIAGGGNELNDGYHGCDTEQSGDYFGDGGMATEADFCHPGHLDIDENRNIYLADEYNCVIRKIYRSGYIETIAGYRPPTGDETCLFSGDGVSADNTITIPSAIELFSSDLDGSNFYFGTLGGDYRIMRSSGRERYCGDGIVEGSEICDYDDWDGITGCEDLGYIEGNLSCLPVICRFDVSECIGESGSECGDGTCDLDESCQTCPQDCGECPPEWECGDGTCDSNETCSNCPADCGECDDGDDGDDGSDGGGGSGGGGSSGSDCGDGYVEGSEECDGDDNLDGQTCVSLGYDLGILTCNDDCTFDESRCSYEEVNPVETGDDNFFEEVVATYPKSKVWVLWVFIILAAAVATISVIVAKKKDEKR